MWGMGYGVWGMGYGVWGMGYGVWGVGYGVWGLGYGVWGMGYGVWGMGYGVWGMGYGVWGMGYGVWGMGYGVWGMGYGVWGMGYGVWGMGYGVWGMGYGVWGMGYGVWGMGYGVWGMGYGVWGMGYGVWGMGYGVWGMGYGVWGMGYGVWGMGYGVWGMGYGVWGMGFKVFAVAGRVWLTKSEKLLPSQDTTTPAFCCTRFGHSWPRGVMKRRDLAVSSTRLRERATVNSRNNNLVTNDPNFFPWGVSGSHHAKVNLTCSRYTLLPTNEALAPPPHMRTYTTLWGEKNRSANEQTDYLMIGKRAYGLPDGKQSAPPMDTRNGGVTRAATSGWVTNSSWVTSTSSSFVTYDPNFSPRGESSEHEASLAGAWCCSRYAELVLGVRFRTWSVVLLRYRVYRSGGTRLRSPLNFEDWHQLVAASQAFVTDDDLHYPPTG
ncbi:unnamed protein product [Spodoptera exigua]|nr:unnamed protein product [Spodoptera exigua]